MRFLEGQMKAKAARCGAARGRTSAGGRTLIRSHLGHGARYDQAHMPLVTRHTKLRNRVAGIPSPAVTCSARASRDQYSIDATNDWTRLHAAVDACRPGRRAFCRRHPRRARRRRVAADTADSYCLDDGDVGHNERLIARASRLVRRSLTSHRRHEGECVAQKRLGARWPGQASSRCLRRQPARTRRRNDRSVPASCGRPANADRHERPRACSSSGRRKIRDVGLCNVTVHEIQAAQSIVKIASAGEPVAV